jgi:hypothetical protein
VIVNLLRRKVWVKDHTVIANKKSNTGDIYLAYHTPHTIDKAFYEFFNTNPDAQYFAWKLQ